MSKATYRLVDDEISDIVNEGADALIKKFRQGFPRGTIVKGKNHVRLAEISLPETIEVSYPKKRIHFPQTKLNGLYEKVK